MGADSQGHLHLYSEFEDSLAVWDTPILKKSMCKGMGTASSWSSSWEDLPCSPQGPQAFLLYSFSGWEKHTDILMTP